MPPDLETLRLSTNPPPEEVLKAAATLETFFEEQGVQNWKLGGCASRKYCEELEGTLISANAAFNECSKRLTSIELKIRQLLRR